MRPLFSRPSAFVLLSLCVAAFGVISTTGCGDKSATDGAYGEAATSAPAPPLAPPPASTAPVTAASPTATMPTPSGNDKNEMPVAPPLASGAAAPPMMNAPFAGGSGAGGPMMGGGDPMAALTPTPDMDKKIAGLQSGSDKKALAAAYADRGFARMNDQNAGPRVKYRKALEDYRVALQNDPTNAKASENKDMIEKIYRDMGRPIPGEESTGGKK